MNKSPRVGDYYYHYKHDNSNILNYCYKIIGVAKHTENDIYLVIYMPLYESEWYDGEFNYSARPLDMFVENVTYNNLQVPRFKLITDADLISKIESQYSTKKLI
jgi:hypothetical protein